MWAFHCNPQRQTNQALSPSMLTLKLNTQRGNLKRVMILRTPYNSENSWTDEELLASQEGPPSSELVKKHNEFGIKRRN